MLINFFTKQFHLAQNTERNFMYGNYAWLS